MMSYTSTRFFDFGKQAILSSENNASLVYSSSSTTIRERNTIFLFDYFDSNLIFCLDVSSAINPAEPIPVILFFVFDFVLIDFLLLFWLHDTKHLIYYKKKIIDHLLNFEEKNLPLWEGSEQKITLLVNT